MLLEILLGTDALLGKKNGLANTWEDLRGPNNQNYRYTLPPTTNLHAWASPRPGDTWTTWRPHVFRFRLACRAVFALDRVIDFLTMDRDF